MMKMWLANRRLAWAIARGNEISARAALAAGASLHALDRTGHTPLHRAVRRESAPLVRLLLNSGADVFAPSRHGETAVEMALRSSDLALVLLLSAAAAGAALLPGMR